MWAFDIRKGIDCHNMCCIGNASTLKSQYIKSLRNTFSLYYLCKAQGSPLFAILCCQGCQCFCVGCTPVSYGMHVHGITLAVHSWGKGCHTPSAATWQWFSPKPVHCEATVTISKCGTLTLGCPKSAKVINLSHELNLSSLTDRIREVNIALTVQVLRDDRDTVPT